MHTFNGADLGIEYSKVPLGSVLLLSSDKVYSVQDKGQCERVKDGYSQKPLYEISHALGRVSIINPGVNISG